MDILIGKNERHNWELIRAAELHDIWFHVADGPSSHCILVTKLKKVAVLCKQHSNSKSLKNVEIHYILICNVQIDEKGNPGSVVLTGDCKSIFI